MGAPLLTAQVFVTCRSVQWDGPAAASTSRTLEQVSYSYRTEIPNGFPYETDFWLFVRFAHYATREFTRDIWLSLIWHDDPQSRSRAWNRRFQTATFRPSVTVRDVAAPVAAVFEGPGRYEFRLWYPVVRRWDGKRFRRTLARTHICIEG